MMKKISLIALLLLALVVSACNYPASQEATTTGQDDTMATEIAKILTGTPVTILITPTADVQGGETAAPEATETVAASATPEVIADTATPSPTQTPTVAPTATLSDTDPALTLGNPDWVDAMDNGNNWLTGYNEYTSVEFKDGFMKLTAETDLDGWRLSWPVLTDAYLEAKVQAPNCSGSDHFGVMFSSPSGSGTDQGYLFGITCDGRYSLRRWDQPNMSYLVNWTESAALEKGKNVQNTLGVMTKGDTIGLYINGIKVKELSDDSFPTGIFGIFVGSDNTDDLTVWVDQIRYWSNP